MPRLIKSITSNLLETYTGNLYFYTSLTAEVQFEDYINLNGFIAYLQNYTQVEYLEELEKPLRFGLKNQYNLPTRVLEISY